MPSYHLFHPARSVWLATFWQPAPEIRGAAQNLMADVYATPARRRRSVCKMFRFSRTIFSSIVRATRFGGENWNFIPWNRFSRTLVTISGEGKNDRWYFIRQQIRFTNAAFTAAFSVASGPREPWLKILDITSHGNIPVELTLNPIAGIFSALVDEHLDGNVFICSKRLRIISIASRCFLYTRPFLPSAVCVFLQIFHLS